VNIYSSEEREQKRGKERERQEEIEISPKHIRILSPRAFQSMDGVGLLEPESKTTVSFCSPGWMKDEAAKKRERTHRDRQDRSSNPEPSSYRCSFGRDESRESNPRGTVDTESLVYDCFEVGEGFDLRKKEVRYASNERRKRRVELERRRERRGAGKEGNGRRTSSYSGDPAS